MLEPFYRFGGRRWAFDRSYQLVPLEAQAAIRAIECENIFGRYSHIRWLFWAEVPYSHAKMAPDRRSCQTLSRVRGIAGANPDLTLAQIGAQLEAMYERTPRGGTRWSPSSTKSLRDRARKLGVLGGEQD